jgi:hypothetical protein
MPRPYRLRDLGTRVKRMPRGMPSADPSTPERPEDCREAIERSVDSGLSSVDLTRESVYE